MGSEFATVHTFLESPTFCHILNFGVEFFEVVFACLLPFGVKSFRIVLFAHGAHPFFGMHPL